MSIAARHPLLWLGVLAAFAATSAWGYAMTYDASGNMLTRSGGGQTWSAKWAGFDKPRWLAKDAAGSEFVYGASRDRAIHLEFDAMSGGAPSHYARKKLYPLGKTVELDYLNTATSGQAWMLETVRLYVPGPEGLLGAMEFRPFALFGQYEKAYVYHYDHLGSIQSVTERGDATLQRALDGVGKPSLYSYDPWGERRDPGDWLGKPTATADGGADDATPRGFTGHEMLDDLGLVHMNGRIYDPLLGRFLSADIMVPVPHDLQSYNRYSYVRNNPLKFVDKDGYKETVITTAQARNLKDSAPLINQEVNRRASFILNAVKDGNIHSSQATKEFYRNITKGMDSTGSDIALSRTVAAQGSEYVAKGESKGSVYDGGIPVPDTFPNPTAAKLMGSENIMKGAVATGLAELNDNKVVVWKDDTAIADGVNIGGNAIGTDKLDHMFEVGYNMQAAGLDAEGALAQSIADEAGISGIDSSGQFSNGDIAANVDGVAFYDALQAAADAVAETGNTDLGFDINNYHLPDWDENQNPNGR